MAELADKLEAARAEVTRLERQAMHATCTELGCNMVSLGGCNCGCMFTDDEGHALPGQCSVPVNHCSRCGDCDYGDNDDARSVRSYCHERWGTPQPPAQPAERSE